MPYITALIPAYNEEITIADVIQACKDCTYIQEIIVVDDGSTDMTSEVAKESGATVYRLENNAGKAMALLTGAKHAKSDILLLLDADLIGLTQEHIIKMILPVLNSEHTTTLGIFKKGRVITDLAHHVTPQLSGQKCIPKSVLLSLENKCNVGYGIEISIHRKLKDLGYEITKVSLVNVTHVTKEEKKKLRSTETESKNRMEMYKDIFKEITSKKES